MIYERNTIAGGIGNRVQGWQHRGERFDPSPKDRFTVHTIGYNENREIAELSIRNKAGEIVYSMGKAAGVGGKKKPASSSKTRVSEMNKELERTGVALDTVLKHYRVSSVEEISNDIFNQAMKKLGNTETKVA